MEIAVNTTIQGNPFTLDDPSQLLTFFENLIGSNFSSDAPVSFKKDSPLFSKVKEMFVILFQEHSEKVNQHKKEISFLETKYETLVHETTLVQEENEQLNEMSLNLLSQIGKLKKYLDDSDVLISLLRAEVSKLKHDKKLAIGAMKESLNGNMEKITKVLLEFQGISTKKKNIYNSRRSCISLSLKKRSLVTEELRLTNTTRGLKSFFPLDLAENQSERNFGRNLDLDSPAIKNSQSLNDLSLHLIDEHNDPYNPQNSTRTDFEESREVENDDKAPETGSFIIFNEDLLTNVNEISSPRKIGNEYNVNIKTKDEENQNSNEKVSSKPSVSFKDKVKFQADIEYDEIELINSQIVKGSSLQERFIGNIDSESQKYFAASSFKVEGLQFISNGTQTDHLVKEHPKEEKINIEAQIRKLLKKSKLPTILMLVLLFNTKKNNNKAPILFYNFIFLFHNVILKILNVLFKYLKSQYAHKQ